MNKGIFWKEEYQIEFEKKGYVTIPILEKKEVEAVLSRISKMKPDDGFDPLNNNAQYHCTFLDSNAIYKQEANDLFLEVFQPKLDKVLDGYGIINGNLYVKPPNLGTFEIHQNWNHNLEHHITTLTCWCPLVDITPENGGLRIVEGSHKIVPDIATYGMPYYFHNIQNELIEKYLKPVYPKAGECIFFDDGLIHWSYMNQSEKPRIAIQIEVLPKGETPVIYIPRTQNGKVTHFDIHEINKKFFIEQNIHSFENWAPSLPKIGEKPNQNHLLTEEEFIQKLEEGPETRKKLYPQWR